MKRWRSLSVQVKVRKFFADRAPDPAKAAAILVTGPGRDRVGRAACRVSHQTKATPSPLFFRMMIHAGYMAQP